MHSSLRGCTTVLEIVFVGHCEVFVCLDVVLFFKNTKNLFIHIALIPEAIILE